MNFDAEATLRSWAIDVDVGGETYTIPALPASDWLLAVATGSYLDIVPGMLTNPAALDDVLLDGRLGDEVLAAARAAISAAAGTTWWAAIRLARAVADTWIGGEFTLRGVDPSRVSFAAYLAAAYRAATKHAEEADRARLDSELQSPPTGVPAEEWFDETEAADNFMAAMATAGAADSE